ncbi:MAG: hypothetical protein NDI80_09065 [Flavobacteriaceae bacterium]|nr:hypothetical protein [Flavobacteriaceae bacterium]
MNLTSTQKAPNPSLVTPHFIIGGVSIVLFAFILVLNPDTLLLHYFNPTLLAATHLLVLGFITTICFGALYQLIPVILDVKLHSEKLGWISLCFLFIGIIFLITAFWNLNFNIPFYLASTFIIIAITIFKINLILTAQKNKQNSLEKKFILTAVGWLFFTVLAGFLFGINLSNNYIKISHLELLKLHAHIGIFGWFIQLIIGVGSKLFPMFLLSYEADKKPLKIAYLAINSGLIIGIFSLFYAFKIGVITAIILIIFGIINFLRFIYQTFIQRTKKKLDVGMKKSIIAITFLLIPLILIVLNILNPNNLIKQTTSLELIYGFTLLVGVISMLIMGLTYKTLPFIIWLKVYKSLIGKQKTPLPRDLYSEKIQTYQLLSFIIGFWTIISGILFSIVSIIQIGTTLFFIATIFYFINIIKIVTHKTTEL